MRKLAMIAAIGLTACSVPAAAETIRLTVVSGAPPYVTYVKAAKEHFIPKVNQILAASGKDIKIEWTEAYSQTLAKFYEVFESVEEGVAQVGLILKNFEESKLPLEQYATVAPFATHNIIQAVEIDRAIRAKVPALNKAYEKYNQIFLTSGTAASHQLWTKFPVHTVDDVKGRKLGSSGAFANWFRGTGAVTVVSSMADSHTNIRNGVYDGYPMNEILGFAYKVYQVAKYLTRVDFGASTVSGITVNMDAWKKFPREVQQAFLEAAKTYPDYLVKIDTANFKKFMGIMKKSGIEVYDMPTKERVRWAKMMPNIATEWADRLEKKGEPGRAVLTAFMDELRARKIPFAREWDKE